MMIYDVFPVNNELDLLEIRLNTLKDVVDQFIISEATHTFTGKPKELHLKNNIERFKEFPILCVEVRGLPHMDTNGGVNKQANINQAKINEMCQKNAFAQSIEIQDDDLLMIGDIDEIVEPKYAKEVIESFKNKTRQLPLRVKMKFFYFNLTNQCDWDWPAGTIFIKGSDFTTFTNVRKTMKVEMTPENHGWHMSYFGNSEFILDKIGNLSDAIIIPEDMKNVEWLQHCIDNHLDPFGRDIKWNAVTELDCPQYLKNNIKRFKEFI